MDEFKFPASDGTPVHCYQWQPVQSTRAVIHISHGMGEHAARYDWVAGQLANAGYKVYASDHRGHGHTATKLGQFGPDGWNRTLLDLKEMMLSHRSDFPGLPVILLGHSMGSMLSQQYIELHGDTLDAVILSGSPGFANPILTWVVKIIATVETWRLGDERESSLLQKLIFGDSNKNFETVLEETTGFEWLSRDPEQVRSYIDDPMCGFVPFPASLKLVFSGASWTQKKRNVAAIPVTLPIYMFSGTSDPVHNELKDIERLLKRYKDADLSVETRFYNDGRHEMLNEINRDEVMQDLLSWIDKTV
ncbi:MAG: alpha-beta hydrolase superfamily lysophospholipase [Candidatus Azotimanducaceae bacterium]|jgi:alpha-beta hydrolase superfamily lysophospholipase